MAEPLLEVSGVETAYGLSQVLFGMSLVVAPGEMVTLMGRNGMGKTTTVRSIMGLTPARGGTIRFAGTGIHGLPSYKIAKLGIGLVPEGRQIFPNLSACARTSSPRRSGAATAPGRSMRSTTCSRACVSARPAWATSSPAANSRCWRSAAH